MRLMSHLVVYILYALREINMKIVVLDGYSANPGAERRWHSFNILNI